MKTHYSVRGGNAACGLAPPFKGTADKSAVGCRGCQKQLGIPWTPEPKEVDPDWKHSCIVCGNTPVLPITDMCGPCTFGEAETAGGNW